MSQTHAAIECRRCEAASCACMHGKEVKSIAVKSGCEIGHEVSRCRYSHGLAAEPVVKTPARLLQLPAHFDRGQCMCWRGWTCALFAFIIFLTSFINPNGAAVCSGFTPAPVSHTRVLQIQGGRGVAHVKQAYP